MKFELKNLKKKKKKTVYLLLIYYLKYLYKYIYL